MVSFLRYTRPKIKISIHACSHSISYELFVVDSLFTASDVRDSLVDRKDCVNTIECVFPIDFQVMTDDYILKLKATKLAKLTKQLERKNRQLVEATRSHSPECEYRFF